MGKFNVAYFSRSPINYIIMTCCRPGPYTRENIERGETKQIPRYGRPVCAVPSTRVQTFRRFLNAVSWTSLNPIKSIEYCRIPTSQQVTSNNSATSFAYFIFMVPVNVTYVTFRLPKSRLVACILDVKREGARKKQGLWIANISFSTISLSK